MREFNTLPSDGFLTSAEAARFLGVTMKTLRSKTWRAQLQAVNIAPSGGRPIWRYPARRLREFTSKDTTL